MKPRPVSLPVRPARRRQVDVTSSGACTSLLLVVVMLAAPVAVNSSDGDAEVYGSSPRTGYACEGSTLSIKCAADTRIRILRANYGRLNPGVCNEDRDTDGWDTQCMSTRSLRIVTDICEDHRECSVMASNSLFGDTCSTTFKYLEIEYTCVSVTLPTTLTTPLLIPDEPLALNSSSKPESTSTTTTTTISTSTIPPPTTSTTPSSTPPTTTRTESASTSSSELPPEPLVTADVFCEATSRRQVEWPRTLPGATIHMQCPNNKDVEEATWRCGTYPVSWLGRPDLSRCVSSSVMDINEMLNDSPGHPLAAKQLEKVADELEMFAETEEVVFGGDIEEVMSAMAKTVDQVEVIVHNVSVAPETSGHLAHKVNDAVLKTGSFLLDERQVESWQDLPQATQAETATRLLSTVENSAYQVARTCHEPATIVNITVNIVIEVNVVDTRGSKKVDDVCFPRPDRVKNSAWRSGGDSIRLTGDTIKQLGVDGLAKIIFATYSNVERFLQPQQDDWESVDVYEQKARPQSEIYFRPTESGHWKTTEAPLNEEETKKAAERDRKIIGTKIISASVGERTSEPIKLKEPVIYTLEHKSDINVYNPTCAFWEYSEKTMSGNWSTFGCKLLETNVTHTTCACEHLTNFAVLMSVSPAKLSLAHEFTLALITYFGCILSIVCLLAAFITFQAFKNLQSDRNTIHKNLVMCLLVAETVFLLGIAQYKHIMLCSVIAGILHYLFLAAFAWMCLEGIQLYVMLVEVFEVEKSRVGWYYAAGYGVPAIIVAISAAVYPGGYGTSTHCWLKLSHGFIWSFVGPACTIICVNIVMLSIAIYIMCRHASSAASSWKMKEKGKLENIRSWIKGAIVLIVLLGPTWAFGLFYVNYQSLVMAYVFTILNSLQGVFIFVFHCLMNEKVVKEYKRWVRHSSWLPSNLRTRCGGTKATPSTTPNNSSSSGVNYLTRLLSNRRRKRSSTTTLPSSTNTVKRGYNKMQRHSSGRDSAQLTDSGIACCPNDDVASHIYSEPTTEDPAAYLDPVRIRLDPDEELYWPGGGEMSLMEGSVADTDYMDDFGRRGPPSSAGVRPINVDNYKIRPPPPSFPLPAAPTERDVKCLAVPEKEPQLSSSSERDVYSSDESLVRRKLIEMGEAKEEGRNVGDGDRGLSSSAKSSAKSSASTLMNNLNKCCSDGSWASGLSAPNITPEAAGRVNHAAVVSVKSGDEAAAETRSLGAGERHLALPTASRNAPIYASIGSGLDAMSPKK